MGAPVRFGRYLLLDKLASGGMADIFLAKATGEAGFEKLCVVKRVLPHLVGSPGFVEMFLDEARISARLNHAGIAQIFDLGRQGDDYFIAMEYLAGQDAHAVLAQLTRQGRPLPVDIAAQVGARAAEALHYVHELGDETGKPLGIVHRDVSPSNLFVTFDGGVKVLDFGIARADFRRAQLTHAGHVKGKLVYMAPEQARGLRVDRRADVWSLGVALFELLAQRRPFDGAPAPPVPRARDLRPEIPPALDEIVARSMTWEPEARYASAEELRRALADFLGERTYVPGAGLKDFMHGLYGEEFIRARSHPVPDVARPPTLDATPPVGPETGTAPVTVTDAARPPARRASRRWPWGLAVLVAGGAVATWASLRPTPVPSRAATATSQVAPSPPPPGPAPEPVAPPPTPTPSPPVPDRPARRVEPPRPEGRLSLESNVDGMVSLDGVKLGALPLSRVRVAAGEHEVMLENRALGARRVERVRVSAGAETSHRITLGKGQLNVSCDPWADVQVDGNPQGQTPVAVRDLWEGRHTVRLTNPSGSRTRVVDLAAGATGVVRERLP